MHSPFMFWPQPGRQFTFCSPTYHEWTNFRLWTIPYVCFSAAAQISSQNTDTFLQRCCEVFEMSTTPAYMPEQHAPLAKSILGCVYGVTVWILVYIFDWQICCWPDSIKVGNGICNVSHTCKTLSNIWTTCHRPHFGNIWSNLIESDLGKIWQFLMEFLSKILSIC